MHAIYLLIIFTVTVLTTFSISINMATIPGTPAMCRVPTSYTWAMTTTSAHSDDTDGTTGSYIGSPTPYIPILPLSAIRIPSFGWDRGNRYSKWLRFRIELDSIFDTLTYASLTAKDWIALIMHLMGTEMQKACYYWQEPECDTMELDI